MKRIKKYLIAIISICTLLLSGCFKSYKAGVHVSDSGIDHISTNNRYKGELDYLGEEPTVIIYDKKTKKSKSFKSESIYNHIVLGDDYFFLYSEPVSSGEKTKIARYTYDGKEIKVLELDDAALQPSLVYEHVDMLKHKFHFTEESKLAIYEYQDGYKIYGCCNLMDELTNPLPLTDHDVNRSWCYRINGKTKEMEVLEEREKTLAMYCTEKNTVYYKDKVVYCGERKTGKRKEITKRKQLTMSVSFDHGHVWCQDDTYMRID